MKLEAHTVPVLRSVLGSSPQVHRKVQQCQLVIAVNISVQTHRKFCGRNLPERFGSEMGGGILPPPTLSVRSFLPQTLASQILPSKLREYGTVLKG